MLSKKYIVLGLVVAGLFFGAYKASRTENTSTQEKFLPGLENNIDNIGTIEILSKGQLFKIQDENGKWLITNKYSYPVSPQKIRDLVLASAMATIAEKKDTEPKDFPGLGVENPEKPDSKAVQITFKSKDGQTTYASYIKGISRKGVSGSLPGKEVYARTVGNNQLYLVHGDLDFNLDAHALLGGEAFAIKYERLESVSFKYPSDKKADFTITKSINGFAITEPKGKTLKEFAKANAIATALEYMELEDILPREKFAASNPEVTIIYKTFSGLALHVDIYKYNGQIWLAFKAEAGSNTQTLKDAAVINTLAASWVYRLNTQSTGGFSYRLEDLE